MDSLQAIKMLKQWYKWTKLDQAQKFNLKSKFKLISGSMERNISWRFEEFWRIIPNSVFFFGWGGGGYSRNPATRIVVRRQANEGGDTGGG